MFNARISGSPISVREHVDCAGAAERQDRCQRRIVTLSEASLQHVDGVRPGRRP